MRFVILLCLPIISFTSCRTSPVQHQPVESTITADTLTVLSFNILYGGDEVDFTKTVELIRRVDPDIVGIQEAEGNIERLANALNWKYYDPRLHILSKYPILTNDSTGWYFAWIEIQANHFIAFSNIHLPSDPYGPELVRDGFTQEQVLKNEDTLRLRELDEHLRIFDLLKHRGVPIVATGDFNSPSHRDWNDTRFLTRSHMRYPIAWPVSVSMEAAGLLDTYRQANPNVLEAPGLTWTPGYPNAPLASNETHDRIDFIWAWGIDATLYATLAGEKISSGVSFFVEPYPSDHRAVVSTLVVTPVQVTALRKQYDYVKHALKDSVQPQLRVMKPLLASGEPIEIEWRNAPGNRFDWIALYPEATVTAHDYYRPEVKTSYLTYAYTRGKRSGHLQLNHQSKGEGWPLKPGKYKIHLLLDDGYTSLASASIEITR